MNISITFRHMDASEAIKRHAQGKVMKLQKFLRQPMTAKVTLSLEKLKHVAETRISSGGAHLEAKESSDDMYVSIDKVMSKLERQIRVTKGAQQAKQRRSGNTLRGGRRPTPVEQPVAPRKKVSESASRPKKTSKKAAKPARSKRTKASKRS